MITQALKDKCVEARLTMTTREVYDSIFRAECDSKCSYETFKRNMRLWKHGKCADEATLRGGTFPKFTTHGATVQVDGNGKITQAWIKQSRDDVDWLEIRDLITKDLALPTTESTTLSGDTMLEIPLYDMHFGIADYDYYQHDLSELLGIINSKYYDEINIIIGQDVLHTNDMRGHTAKGTDIQRIDFPRAWADAFRFFRMVIETSVQHSPHVAVRYSKGNHDECSAWGLFKALEVLFPQCAFDDSLAVRKCISWRGCFIGFGHCEYTNRNADLFQDFVLDFPREFAEAKVREIHAGHKHRESIDEGLVVRRLPTAVPTDEWSSNNGYVGAHKRFQVFEWADNRLWATYYI